MTALQKSLLAVWLPVVTRSDEVAHLIKELAELHGNNVRLIGYRAPRRPMLATVASQDPADTSRNSAEQTAPITQPTKRNPLRDLIVLAGAASALVAHVGYGFVVPTPALGLAITYILVLIIIASAISLIVPERLVERYRRPMNGVWFLLVAVPGICVVIAVVLELMHS